MTTTNPPEQCKCAAADLLRAIDSLIAAHIEDARPKESWEARRIGDDPLRDARNELLAALSSLACHNTQEADNES